jgi:hypothetical protein
MKIFLLVMLSLASLVNVPAQTHNRTASTTPNKSENPAEADRREGERLLRAYFNDRLLECGGSWWWVERYQSCGRGGCSIDNKLHQGKGAMRFVFDGRYTPPRTLSLAEKLNGADPQPIEYEGTMWVIFEAARCANCNGDRGWLGGDNSKVGMTISKKHGQWSIAEFADPYNSIRKPACANDGKNILSSDEYLTPKTRFNGDYRLKELETSATPVEDVAFAIRKLKLEEDLWQFEITLPPRKWVDTGIPVIVNKGIGIRTETKQPPAEWLMKIGDRQFARGDSFRVSEGPWNGDPYAVGLQPQEVPTLQFYLKGTQSTRLEITIKDAGRCIKCIVGCPDDHKRLHEQGQREAQRLLGAIK